MELTRGDAELETLNKKLDDPAFFASYKKQHDGYKTSTLPYLLGNMLVWCGNIVYGFEPSYLKFRSVEVIARVPYNSWSSADYTLQTLFYSNEHKAMMLGTVTNFARIAQDNETMHVVVISKLAREEERAGLIRHTLIPMLFAFFYFWTSYLMYLVRPRWSFELNYLFESHAFSQYALFVTSHEEELLKKKVSSEFLDWYGRKPKNQYEFFRSVRNDEIVHRNQSIESIDKKADAKRVEHLTLLCLSILGGAVGWVVYCLFFR